MNKKHLLIRQIQQLAGVENVSHLLISPESNDFMVVEIYFDPKTVEDRLTTEEVAIRNYNATVKRGLINERTTLNDFLDKLEEEVNEFHESFDYPKLGEHGIFIDTSELADISLVCDSIAQHYAIDLQKEKELKMLYNELRND